MRKAASSAVIVLFVLASVAGYASTTKPCTANCTTTVGTLTYLGNDSQGHSVWTVTVQTRSFFSTPLVLNTVSLFVKGTKQSGGPFVAIPDCSAGPFMPNNACLLFLSGGTDGLAACNDDCISVAFQFLAGDGTTFTVKNNETGHLLNYYGTVNAFIIPTFGHKAIQAGDKTTIFMQIRSITYP